MCLAVPAPFALLGMAQDFHRATLAEIRISRDRLFFAASLYSGGFCKGPDIDEQFPGLSPAKK